jgi:MFS family permease
MSWRAKKSQVSLLAALGVDNFGSGLFLPLTVVYVTRVAGLALCTAGTVVSLGTLAGLAVPPLAGRLVDRAGPKTVVISSQLLQAFGVVTYLLAHAAMAVLLAAILLAVGQQMFYSSLFTLVSLVSDASGSGPHDRPFALTNMVRCACFGLGGLVTGGILTAAGSVALRIAVATDGGSFIACSLLLALLVHIPRRPAAVIAVRRPARPGILADKPFMALIVITGLAGLAVDFYLTGTSVYILDQLHGQSWLPGTTLALSTALSSLAGTAALRATRRLTRMAALQLSAALYALWCGVSLVAILVPPGWRPAELVAATVVMAAATLVSGPRAVALASAVAPPSARGRYLAAFQYAFTGAGVLAPAIVALYSVAVWLPWTLVAASTSLAIVGLRALARHLPAAVLTPATTPEPSPKVPRPRDSPHVPPNLPKAEAEIPCR